MSTPDVLTIERPDQLKALGHPLRLRVLEILSESERPLTNRELAHRLAVDPGHLHFHVRMLLGAGLIERADSDGREKPYRPVARNVRVAPELLATGAANDARAAMLEEVRHGLASWAASGRFRSAQLTARISEDDARELVRMLAAEAEKRENAELEPLVISVFSHPRAPEAAEGS